MTKARCICMFQKVNILKIICNHAIGKQHTIAHRMIVGFAIIVIGVIAVEYTAEYHFVKYITKIAGDGLDAIGITPYVEYVGGLEAEEA